jgi:hypothetical protein
VRRILLIAAIVVTVLIVIYLAIASISFIQFISGIANSKGSCSNSDNSGSSSLAYDNSGSNSNCGGMSGSSSMELAPNNMVEFPNNISISNDGFFTVTDFQLHEILSMQSGAVLSEGSSPSVSIPAGSSQTVSPSPTIGFKLGQGTTQTLLTKDTNLTMNFGINVSYAYLFTLSLQLSSNYSWGAPFSDYLAVVSPVTSANGSQSVTVRVTFQNDASFPVGGSFTLTLLSNSNQQCGTTTLSVPSTGGSGNGGGSSFNQTTGPVTLTAGCTPHGGGHVETGFASPDLNLDLPLEAVP